MKFESCEPKDPLGETSGAYDSVIGYFEWQIEDRLMTQIAAETLHVIFQAEALYSDSDYGLITLNTCCSTIDGAEVCFVAQLAVGLVIIQEVRNEVEAMVVWQVTVSTSEVLWMPVNPQGPNYALSFINRQVTLDTYLLC